MHDRQLKTKRILIVDDEEVIRRLLGRLFSNAPYDLVMAGSVQEGLAKVAEQDFHLLITDLRLPDGDGVTVIRRFKEKFPSSKVIIMTGSLTPEDRLTEVNDVPITECLSKPFELDVLRRVVMKAMGE